MVHFRRPTIIGCKEIMIKDVWERITSSHLRFNFCFKYGLTDHEITDGYVEFNILSTYTVEVLNDMVSRMTAFQRITGALPICTFVCTTCRLQYFTVVLRRNTEGVFNWCIVG